jgi:serine/threonine protein kinase
VKGQNVDISSGHLKGEHPDHVPLVDRVESEEAVPLLFDFLSCALKWEPRERGSAAQLLEHQWLKDA